MNQEPKGPAAAEIRQQKFELVRRLQLPVDGLPGSMAMIHMKCGKESCHCAKGEKHVVWSLTYMEQGRKKVQRIPQEWVEDVRKRVDAAREFREGVGRVFVANANLLALMRQQTREQRRRKRKR